jgi:hypothetical protein
MLHASGLFVGFIGDSSPAASVEGTRRSPHLPHLHNKTALRPPGSCTRAAYPYWRPSRLLDGNFVSWEFIVASSPRTTLEGARRLPESAYTRVHNSEMAAGS